MLYVKNDNAKVNTGNKAVIAFALMLMLFIAAIIAAIFNMSAYTFMLITIVLVFCIFFAITFSAELLYAPGSCVLLIILFVKYIVLPFLIIINGKNDTYFYGYKTFALYLYEEICVLFTFAAIIRRKNKTQKEKSPSTLLAYNNAGRTTYLAVVVLSLLIIVFVPRVLSQYSFIWTSASEYTVIKSHEAIRGLWGMVFSWGILLLPIVLTDYICKSGKNADVGNFKFFIICVIMLFFNLCIFSGSSRNSAIIPTVAAMYVLIMLFPKKRKFILAFFSLCIVIGLFVLTALKMSYTGGSINGVESFENVLQSYFSGPRSSDYSLKAYENYRNSFSFTTFADDYFGNFPGISSLFDLENRTSTFYNLTIYNGRAIRDQIIPMVGQGVFHFGFILSPIYSVISVILCCMFDRKCRNAPNKELLFIFAYAAVRCAMGIMSNVSILLSSFASLIIPTMVIGYLGLIFAKKRKNKQ